MSNLLENTNKMLTGAGVPHENPSDETEPVRRVLTAAINSSYSEEEQERYNQLVEDFGANNVWDTDQVSKAFVIEGFMAPFVVARKRDTGERGSLQFCHHPRFYFNWKVDSR